MKRLVMVTAALFISTTGAVAGAPEPFVVFCSDRDGDNEIYRMDADGSNVVQLTFNDADEFGTQCSPDGRWIAFESDREGNYDIYVMAVDGSDLRRLTFDPAVDFNVDWSRDGTKLAFSSARDGDREIYSINADGSGLQQLTHNDVEDAAPGWSPDGTKIALHKARNGTADIWTINSTGGSPQNLTADVPGDFMPDFSPDGDEIVFESFRDVPLELYIMNADGSGLRRLTRDFSDNHEPDWSPDGSRILYSSYQGDDYDIMVIAPDGTGRLNLTNNAGVNDWSPSWCPVPLDDTTNGGGTGVLAFCNQPVSAPDVHEIWTIRIDGTQRKHLIESATGLNHHEWSPDGAAMAAVGYVDAATWSIYTFDTGGTGLTRLTHNAGVWDNEPSWSPDGSRIAWGRIYPSEGNRSELWVMNADGTGQHAVGVDGDGVCWSPDGTRFVYHKELAGTDIWTCSVDGSGEQRLTAAAGDNMTPDWSPDGSRIAFVSTRDGNYEIYVMNADGTGQRRLTNNLAMDFYPKWSPDGSLLAYTEDVTGAYRWEVFVMDSSGTDVRRVTHSPPDRTAINPDWQPPDSTAVPVYLMELSLDTSGFSVRLAWEVAEAASPGDFRVVARRGGRSRDVSVEALGGRRFQAVDADPALRAAGRVVYELYDTSGDPGPRLLGTKSVDLQVPPVGLRGVYPNPFNPGTTVWFSLNRAQSVTIGVYDAAGRRVVVLDERLYPAGDHRIRWDGRDAAGHNAASGVYFVRLHAGKHTWSRKLILVR